MDIVSIISLAMGSAWASGINLYAAVFILGYLGSTGHITLPGELDVVTQPLVMTVAGVMYCIEFFTDKIPGVDTGWDALHTFVRIPAAAVLAMGTIGEVSPAASLAAGLAGGTIAANSHFVKAGSRVLINTSPEPLSNWTASVTEDIATIGGLWVVLYHPWLFLTAFVIFIAFTIWLLPKLGKGIKRVGQNIARLINRRQLQN